MATNDLFSTILQECSWRGISFPIEMVGERGSQTLAVHHRMDRDVSQVEATGRQSYNFTVRAYFLQGLLASPNETWIANDLFPATWIKVRAALEDKTTGVFVHPLYGQVSCKPVDWNVQFVSDIRNGVIVEMSFLETEDPSAAITVQVSVISGLNSAATNLDTQLANIPLPPGSPTPIGTSTSTIDPPTNLGQGSYSNAISFIQDQPPSQAAIYTNTMISSLYDFNTDLQFFPDIYAPLFSTTYQLIVSLQAYLLQLGVPSLNTKVIITSGFTTLSSLAQDYGNSMDQLISLNPLLATTPLIFPGTNVTISIF